MERVAPKFWGLDATGSIRSLPKWAHGPDKVTLSTRPRRERGDDVWGRARRFDAARRGGASAHDSGSEAGDVTAARGTACLSRVRGPQTGPPAHGSPLTKAGDHLDGKAARRAWGAIV